MKLISSLIAISLSGTLLLNILYVPLTYAFYYLDQSGFIELLCENKDEPELECNGKCHLKKVTQSDTEKSDNLPSVILEKELILYLENPIKETAIKLFEERTIFDYYVTHYSYTEDYSLFHPPQV